MKREQFWYALFCNALINFLFFIFDVFIEKS